MRPASNRDVSSSGASLPIVFGVWQSWQPTASTRYLPRSTALGAGFEVLWPSCDMSLEAAMDRSQPAVTPAAINRAGTTSTFISLSLLAALHLTSGTTDYTERSSLGVSSQRTILPGGERLVHPDHGRYGRSGGGNTRRRGDAETHGGGGHCAARAARRAAEEQPAGLLRVT